MKMGITLWRDIKSEFIDLYKFRWVSYSFISSNILVRYKRSFLGFFWSLLGPAINYIVVGTVFSYFARSDLPNYFVFMFSGAAIYNFIGVVINQSPGVMINNEGYIKKIYLPKSIFIVNTVLIEFVNFSLGLLVLFFLGLVFGKLSLNFSYFFLLFPVFFALVFSFGIASIVSISAVFFRDIIHIVPVIMQAVFFATPILYPIQAAPLKFQKIIVFNPLFHFVECFRYPIYYQALPPVSSIIWMVGSSSFMFLFGIFLLKKFDNKIIFKL